ncbi:MAG TPA: DinB family protein [Saprospiraceae bacterium]|nr:DinB family protein [Saprospiraceae bacterium]
MKTVANNLSEAIEYARPQLEAMSESQAAFKTRPEKWSAKEIIGHLIDSAANNHQRFVRAQMGVTALQPYRYAQDNWVKVQEYQSADWKALVSLWYFYNVHLAHVIAGMQAEFLDNELDVWDEPATLRFVAEDYVRHLKHHLDQIFTLEKTI